MGWLVAGNPKICLGGGTIKLDKLEIGMYFGNSTMRVAYHFGRPINNILEETLPKRHIPPLQCFEKLASSRQTCGGPPSPAGQGHGASHRCFLAQEHPHARDCVGTAVAARNRAFSTLVTKWKMENAEKLQPNRYSDMRNSGRVP